MFCLPSSHGINCFPPYFTFMAILRAVATVRALSSGDTTTGCTLLDKGLFLKVAS